MAHELRAKRPLTRLSYERDLRGSIDRLWESIARPRPLFSALQKTRWIPATDVCRTERAIFIMAELPGLTEHDFELTLTGETLMLNGSKTRPDASAEYSRSERAYGTFARRIPLPPDADLHSIDATFRNGLLEVRVPIDGHAKRKLRLRACSVCHGDLFPDDDDDELVCLQCGRRTATQAPRGSCES